MDRSRSYFAQSGCCGTMLQRGWLAEPLCEVGCGAIEFALLQPARSMDETAKAAMAKERSLNIVCSTSRLKVESRYTGSPSILG
jgi:hypothetical protein